MSTPRVEAVLWDADGVLQHDPPPWAVFFADPLGERAGPIGDEIFADLRPALLGQVDMRARVAEVLGHHGLGDRLEPVLAAWRAIEPLPDSRRLVAGLVEAGVACHLATNQDDWRAAVMREQMGYADLLERSYYSCDLGLAKPDPAYFTHVLTDLDLPAARVAFVDDRLPNVEGAASVGVHAVHWHHTDGLNALTDRLASWLVPTLELGPGRVAGRDEAPHSAAFQAGCAETEDSDDALTSVRLTGGYEEGDP